MSKALISHSLVSRNAAPVETLTERKQIGDLGLSSAV